MSFPPLSLKKCSGYTNVNEVPWKYFVKLSFTNGIKINIHSTFCKSFHPEFIFETFRPGVKETAFLISFLNDLCYLSISSCQNAFQNGDIGLMPIVFDTFLVELIFDLMIDNIGSVQELLLGTHLRPLERRKGLRHEEGSADYNLALSVSLFLRYLIITLSDLLCQPCNTPHIFLGLSRMSQHEIQFYTVPAALEGLSGTV